MKKMFLLLMMALAAYMDVSAKPSAHFDIGGDISIGRRKFNCKQIWFCIDNGTFKVHVDVGMIASGNHGLVLDEDGSLSIAINQTRMSQQDIEKYNQLASGTINLSSDETLPQEWLSQLGYKGSNVFKAGTYRVTVYQGYFLIHL